MTIEESEHRTSKGASGSRSEPKPPAATVAAFEAAIRAFAANYRQSETFPSGTPVQERNYKLGDTSDYQQILLAATKFRAEDLIWVQPLTATPDGHAVCSFTLALFPSED